MVDNPTGIVKLSIKGVMGVDAIALQFRELGAPATLKRRIEKLKLFHRQNDLGEQRLQFFLRLHAARSIHQTTIQMRRE